MNLVAEARAIMALLQPLMGGRATGNAVVNASPGPTATLPANSYAVPVMGGSARWDQLVKTAENPASDAGWPITTGTSVPILSNLGGAALNIPAGTVLRWFPAVAGIEQASVVGPGGLTGGTQLSGLTAVRQIAWFEELGAATGAEVLSKALVTAYPALMLAWESTGPRTAVGRNQYVQTQNWSVYIITSRTDADPQRRLEGLMLVDVVRAYLEGRTQSDGFKFTNSGINILGAQLVSASEAWYIYRVRFATETATAMREGWRTFNPWIRTRLDVTTPTPVADGGIAVVTDNELLMPQ